MDDHIEKIVSPYECFLHVWVRSTQNIKTSGAILTGVLTNGTKPINRVKQIKHISRRISHQQGPEELHLPCVWLWGRGTQHASRKIHSQFLQKPCRVVHKRNYFLKYPTIYQYIAQYPFQDSEHIQYSVKMDCSVMLKEMGRGNLSLQTNTKSIPLKRAKTPASHNQKIRLDSLNLMADYFFGITFLDPCLTRNLQSIPIKHWRQILLDPM